MKVAQSLCIDNYEGELSFSNGDTDSLCCTISHLLNPRQRLWNQIVYDYSIIKQRNHEEYQP